MSTIIGQTTVTDVELFEDALFDGLYSTSDGGALVCEAPGTATILGSTFSNNATNKNAGAIYNDEDASIVIAGSTFTDNRTKSNGAAIYNCNGVLSLNSVAFLNNISTHGFGMGGAIYNNSENAVAMISDCLFYANSASYAGAIYHEIGNLTISGSTFSKNLGKVMSGAIENDANMVVIASEFYGNNGVIGAGIYNFGGDLSVTDSVFANGAGQYGIGIYSNGFATVSYTDFINNTASNSGAAIYNEGTLSVFDSKFSGNYAEEGGAIYNAKGSTIYIGNAVFATETDSIYTTASKMYVSGNIKSNSTIDFVGKCELHFTNDSGIAVSGAINIGGTTSKVAFDTGGYIEFSDALDLSNVSLTASLNWSASNNYTLAAGDLTFKNGQTIKVNGTDLTIGTEKIVDGKIMKAEVLENETTQMFVVTRCEEKITDIKSAIEQNTASAFGFASSTDGVPFTKADFGTNNLVAGADKDIIGNGSAKTIVAVNVFGNGNDLNLADINCSAFVFGGGNGSHTDGASETLTLSGDISAAKVFAGARIASDVAAASIDSDLVLADDVNGSFSILCAGNLVSSSATEFTDTSATITGSGVDVSDGFVIGGSLVSKPVEYTAYGTAATDISGGSYDWVCGSGFLQGEGGSYTQNGNININISGGSINTLFGGIASDKADYGTKNILGDINILVDTSVNEVSLYSVFAGSNGANCSIEGNISVTFTGKGDNLHFLNSIDTHSGIIGDSATKSQTVTGTRTFTFDAFVGDFTADVVKKFDAFHVVSGSAVSMRVYDLSAVHEWVFDADSTLTWNEGHANNFAGDTLAVGTDADELSSDGFAFFMSDDANMMKGWKDFSSVKLFGQDAEFDDEANMWASDDFKLACFEDENDYKLIVSAKLA